MPASGPSKADMERQIVKIGSEVLIGVGYNCSGVIISEYKKHGYDWLARITDRYWEVKEIPVSDKDLIVIK